MLHDSSNVETLYLHTAKIPVKTMWANHCTHLASNSVLFQPLLRRSFGGLSGLILCWVNAGALGVFDDPQECHSDSHVDMDWRHLQKVNGENNRYSQQNWMRNLFKINTQQTSNATAEGSQGIYTLHTAHTEGLNQLNHDQLFYTSFLKYSFSLPG